MCVCDREGWAEPEGTELRRVKDGGSDRSSPPWGKERGAGEELGSSGSGAAALRWVGVGAARSGSQPWLHLGTQCTSHILIPVRSEPEDQGRGREQPKS